jgi:hypothetical protein
MSSLEWRCAVAVVLGVALEVVFIWRFLPYSQRDWHHILLPLYALPILAFLAGLVLTIGMEQNKHYVPFALVGGLGAANACVIIIDCWNNPALHHLWPFEFLAIMVLSAPAFMGAEASRFMHRVRKN